MCVSQSRQCESVYAVGIILARPFVIVFWCKRPAQRRSGESPFNRLRPWLDLDAVRWTPWRYSFWFWCWSWTFYCNWLGNAATRNLNWICSFIFRELIYLISFIWDKASKGPRIQQEFLKLFFRNWTAIEQRVSDRSALADFNTSSMFESVL